jgi:hypothetical protein
MRSPCSLTAVLLTAVIMFVGTGCGAENASLHPATVIRLEAGQVGPEGPCDSWLGVGIAAAYCANGHEAPAPNTGDQSLGELQFTGLKRSAASGGISQAAGTLPQGGTIGLKVSGETKGTLLAHGLCDGMTVKAAFYDQRFVDGAKGSILIQRTDDVPVIVLTLDGQTIAPDREVAWALSWLPAEAKHVCAFAIR